MGENLEALELDWHSRFQQQARWTEPIRQYLYKRSGLRSARRILEVGCGTGVLLSALETRRNPAIHGLDINQDHLQTAIRNSTNAFLAQADAHLLPYLNASFDLSFCHFLLLWVSSPLQVIREMRRVTRPGGAVLALAEPDYGGRIDYPEKLADIGRLQSDALKRQGANPNTGRLLSGIFHRVGLENVEYGLLGGQWSGKPALNDLELEWQVLESDMQGLLSPDGWLEFRLNDLQAWQDGERVLFVPTFYAWGRVP